MTVDRPLLALLRHGQRPTIPAAAVAEAAEYIDRTGIAEQVAKWRQLDREPVHAGGRPARLGDRAVLAVMLLLATENSPLLLSRATEVVESRLTETSLEVLGIDINAPGVNWYTCFWSAWHRFQDVLDAHPAPRGRFLSDDEATLVKKSRDPLVCAEKARRLSWVVNQLIDGAWKMLPREVRRSWKGNIAIDATLVAAHAKPSSKRSPRTVEVDAAWYVREGDHRDPGDASGRPVKKAAWGWEAHLAIATGSDPNTPPDFPLMVTAMTFDRPGFNVGENALELLTSMKRRKMPVGIVTTDRAYWPGAKADKLQLPARAMGWRNCNDYGEKQLGISDHCDGAIQVEGAWYSPSMPKSLVEATIDFRVAKTIDEVTWQARIAAREPYLLHAKGRPNQHGDRRFSCPAAGPSPTSTCPLRALFLTLEQAATKPRVTPPRTHGKICQQASITIPATVGAKHRQDIRFGTPEWHAHCANARNTIEGFNGFIKDGAREGLADGSRRRLRGRTAQHLLVALLVVAANLRKLQTWVAEKDGSTVTPIRKSRSSRRKTPSLKTYLPSMTDGDPPQRSGTSN